MKTRITAVLLALVMLLGTLGGCQTIADAFFSTQPSDNDPSYIVKRLEENGYTETVYPRIGASTMKYTLTEENMDEFYKKVDLCEEIYRGGASADKEKMKKLLYETNSYLRFIEAQGDIAYLFYYSDLKDEQALENYNYAYECYLDASSRFYEFMWLRKTVNNYLTAVLKEFEAKELDLVEVDADLDDVRKARQSIVTKYNAIESPGDENKKDEVYKIYVEYVKNSYDYARAYRYKNYYEMTCDGDYTAKDREAFREYVKKYIVPLCIEYSKGYKEFDATLTEREYNISLAIDVQDYREFNRKLIYDYYDSLGGTVGATMKEIFTRDKIVNAKGDDGYEIAFNKMVGNTVLCYFPEITELDTVATQSAYYCGTRLHGNTSEELETLYAYSNMLLFMSFLDGKVNKMSYDSYTYYRLYDHMYQIIGCTIKDEFDEIIFNNSRPGTISLAEMERYMELLIEEYRVAEYGGEKAVNQLKTYWSRRGVYDSCSMFSGAVSMCAALDIYAEATVDYKAAAKTFCFVMENIYSKRDFIGTMSRAGINSPFREEFYTNVSERLAWKE